MTHEEGLACGGERISVLEFPVGHLDGTFQLQTSNVQVWGQAEKSYVKVKIWDRSFWDLVTRDACQMERKNLLEK